MNSHHSPLMRCVFPLVLFGLICCVVSVSSGQQQWNLIHPAWHGVSIMDLHAFDSQDVLFVGAQATIIRTRDRGESWETTIGVNNLAPGINFNHLFFTDNLNGWILGGGVVNNRSETVLLRTTDSGENWTEVTIPEMLQGKNLTHVYFPSSETGYLAGYDFNEDPRAGLFKTDNAGEDWVQLDHGLDTFTLIYELHFHDDETGWAGGSSGVIIHTTDGGETWTQQESGIIGDIRQFFFLDDSNGWVTTSTGRLYHTTDGGDSWEQDEFAAATADPALVHFWDVDNGLIQAGTGNFFKKNGPFWNLWFTTYENNYKVTRFVVSEDTYLWGVGENGRIIYSDHFFVEESYEVTWSDLHDRTSYAALEEIQFHDTMYGWAAGSSTSSGGTILKTIDGGINWENVGTDVEINALTLYVVDDQTVWFGGDWMKLAHTTDGGETWSTMTLSEDAAAINTIHFVDSQTGWAAGSWGMFFKTVDGGSTWEALGVLNDQIDFDYDIHSVFFLNEQTGWLAGGHSFFAPDFVYKTTDGGETWEHISPNLGEGFKSIYFTDAQRGWVAGSGGALAGTVDGGHTWLVQDAGTNRDFDSVRFLNRKDGVAAAGLTTNGNHTGMLFVTHDGGENWEEVLIAGQRFRDVYLHEGGTVVAAGTRGTIVQGRIDVSEVTNSEIFVAEMPAEFLLVRQYPNPFNPSSYISVTVREPSTLSIRVYDVMGRMVSEVFNGLVGTGSHVSVFNAQNLSSGMYIYRVEAHSESGVTGVYTDKMVLLK